MPGQNDQPSSPEQVNVDAWYRQYGELVYRRCLRMTRADAQAWDLTQETFLKAHRHQGQFRGEGSPLGWLYRIANRCFLDSLGKKAPIPTAEVEAFVREEAEHPDAVFVRRDLIVRLLSRIPKDVREVVLHRYFDEMEYEQIAETMNIDEKTVRRKLQRFFRSARIFIGSAE